MERKQTGYVNGPFYQVPNVRPTFFGGRISPDLKSNLSKTLPVDYVVIDSFSNDFYRAVSVIPNRYGEVC